MKNQSVVNSQELKDGAFGIVSGMYDHNGRLVQKQPLKIVLLSPGRTRIGDSWSSDIVVTVQPIAKKSAINIINKLNQTDKSEALNFIQDYKPKQKKQEVNNNTIINNNNPTRLNLTTPAGNNLCFFYNPKNNLIVIDLMKADESGGNEIFRKTLDEKELLRF